MSAAIQLPKFTIFADSCCLFTPKETQIVSHPFTKLFQELKSKCDLQLAIPRIVFGELLSQKMFRCEQSFEKATSNIRQIAKLPDSELFTYPTIQELRAQLETRFDDWIADLGAVVVDIPKDIDWPALIDNAVWRRPPFSPRTEADPSTEKGFKDALILETLLAFHEDTQDREIVFVCPDGLLSKTAAERLANQSRFLPVKSLNEFGSHVDLLLENWNKEWITAVLSKARKLFFSKEDPNCLWFRFGILEQIHNVMGVRLTGFFGDVYEPHGPTYLYPDVEAVPKPWKPVTEEFPLIRETILLPVANDGFYHWQTEVQLRQLFEPKDAVQTYLGTYDRLRKLVANVNWKCKISPETSFTEETVEGVAFVSENFEKPGPLDYVLLRFLSRPSNFEDLTTEASAE